MLLTTTRVRVLDRINRFAGWTSRPYSVLEHSVIGAARLREEGASHLTVRAFLLHDMEETEFGDIITPIKRKFMPEAYFQAVDAWNRELSVETGVPMHEINSATTDGMDRAMVRAEKAVVSTKTHSTLAPVVNQSRHDHITRLLDCQAYAGRAPEAFWLLWEGFWP